MPGTGAWEGFPSKWLALLRFISDGKPSQPQVCRRSAIEKDSWGSEEGGG